MEDATAEERDGSIRYQGRCAGVDLTSQRTARGVNMMAPIFTEFSCQYSGNEVADARDELFLMYI